MKFWLLRPIDPNSSPWRPPYDCAVGFVVCASDEAEARAFAQSKAGDEARGADWNHKDPVWDNPSLTTCIELLPSTPGVILRDFNAA